MTFQPDLLQWTPPQILGDRDGETFDRSKDLRRLNKQAQDVYLVMADGRPHTLREISEATGHPEASVSARLRDLRKPTLGGFIIDRQRIAESGTWTYRLAGKAE